MQWCAVGVQWGAVAYQLLEGGLLQVALQGEVTEALPGRLVGLDLHWVSRHGAVVSDWTASHQRGARQALEILRDNMHSVGGSGDFLPQRH